MSDVEIGDKKDFNVNLDYLNTYAAEYFTAVRISAALMVTDNEQIQQALFDKFREKLYILLEAMISSERFNDWKPEEKLEEFLKVNYVYRKERYLTLHKLLTDISHQNSIAKVMDARAKRIKSKDMFK